MTPAPPTTAPGTTPNLSQAEPEDVLLSGAEGLALHGTWRSAGGRAAPAVLLLPMYGGRRQDWDSIAESLQEAGFASLALDLRGQGDTRGTEDWSLAVGGGGVWRAGRARGGGGKRRGGGGVAAGGGGGGRPQTRAPRAPHFSHG